MTAADPEALRALLEDLRNHVVWQEREFGRELILDHAQVQALRAARRAASGQGSRENVVRSGHASGPPSQPERSLGQSLRDRLMPGRPATAAARVPSPASSTGLAGPAAGTPPAAPMAASGVAISPAPAAPAVRRPLEPTPMAASTGAPRMLAEVRAELGDCRRCGLCHGRRSIVFGTGNPRAELVFVGEAPGVEEDAQGTPFVGEAGKLLTKMIEAMGYRRDDVYICNLIKCRPPNNRNPEPAEIAACEPFLKAQLASLQPKAVVALGKFAAQALLRDDTAISRMRGLWREYEGIPLMPTYHPAYLLRQPNEKRKVWSDLQQVMQRLGKSPTAK